MCDLRVLAGTERGDDQEEIAHCALECARAYRDSLKVAGP